MGRIAAQGRGVTQRKCPRRNERRGLEPLNCGASGILPPWPG